MRALPVLLALVACGPTTATPPSTDLGLPTPERFAESHGRFDSYWYQGVAELTRYRLEQARYGEVHEGEAVLIFVTEDFLPGPQLKHERGPRPVDALSVLKLNAHRQFFTGIYPYTTLTSTFLPAEEGPALKVAASVIEWCGVAYGQLNRREDGVHAELHSYFEAEGDAEITLDDVALEDALFSRLRRDPNEITAGPTHLVPAMHYLRFAHRPMQPYAAEVSFEDEEATRVLVVRYAELGRELRIRFGRAFPHVIEGWEERDAQGPTTRATRTHAILTDYWAHHGVADAPFREALGVGAR
ncbi:MAG: septum formation inhibitor Maf [Sandaracinus sp.]|nr:septum formation inhibitor Maf [Sandaracinus sp.]MCB9625647.1 septum formation inhibitor Maf [Sandaracinus sp.]